MFRLNVLGQDLIRAFWFCSAHHFLVRFCTFLHTLFEAQRLSSSFMEPQPAIQCPCKHCQEIMDKVGAGPSLKKGDKALKFVVCIDALCGILNGTSVFGIIFFKSTHAARMHVLSQQPPDADVQECSGIRMAGPFQVWATNGIPCGAKGCPACLGRNQAKECLVPSCNTLCGLIV